jgi:hypothetical protein
MKIEKQYLKNYIVHAISILELDLLKQLMSQLPKTIKDKIEISSYLHTFEVIFRLELDELDTYFEVTHGTCKTSNEYIYTFTANYSRKNFSIKFIDSTNGMFYIEECNTNWNSKTITNLGFNKNNIEAPF